MPALASTSWPNSPRSSENSAFAQEQVTMSSPKNVAIVGAGPGGLACAHKQLKLTPHSVTIFDKASRVGGLWERNSLNNPEMHTNICRFTVAFSDLAWESVILDDQFPCTRKRGWWKNTCNTTRRRTCPRTVWSYLLTPRKVNCEISRTIRIQNTVPILHSISMENLTKTNWQSYARL